MSNSNPTHNHNPADLCPEDCPRVDVRACRYPRPCAGDCCDWLYEDSPVRVTR